MKAATKGEWIVRMRCDVTRDVYVTNCTKEQAQNSPWDYAEHEEEVEKYDWRVVSVRENK